LPRGAKLAVAYPDAVHVVAVPQVHLAAMAVVRRAAFVPTLFAIPGQQPLELRPPWAALAAAAQPALLWAAFVGGDPAVRARLAPVLVQYEFIAFVNRKPFAVTEGRCLQPFFQQPSFKLFSILADPGCPGAPG
jgi:hypothetical protein